MAEDGTDSDVGDEGGVETGDSPEAGDAYVPPAQQSDLLSDVVQKIEDDKKKKIIWDKPIIIEEKPRERPCPPFCIPPPPPPGDKKIIGYTGSEPNCLCSDDKIYTNCGRECECCEQISADPMARKGVAHPWTQYPKTPTTDPVKQGVAHPWTQFPKNPSLQINTPYDDGNGGQFKIIGYDEDGNPNCECADGKRYTNCGPNCECCNETLQNIKTLNKLTYDNLIDLGVEPDAAKAIIIRETEENPDLYEGPPRIKSMQIDVSEERLVKTKGQRAVIKIYGDKKAKFNLTIDNSDDCSILKSKIENVEIDKNGVYSTIINFPAIKPRKTEEVYTIRITPTDASIIFDDLAKVLPKKLYQYPQPTITISDTSKETGPALSVSRNPSTLSFTGPVDKYVYDQASYPAVSQVLTITEDSGTAGYFYIKDIPKFNNSLIESTLFKKILKRDDFCTNCKEESTIKLETATDGSDGTTITRTDTDDITTITGFSGSVFKTKEVQYSLDSETEEVIADDECIRETNKFRLLEANATDDLFVGMTVSGYGFFGAKLISIDSKTDITLDSTIEIKNTSEITFEYHETLTIKEVFTTGDNKGRTTVALNSPTKLPHNTELISNSNTNKIHGKMSYTGSGTDSIVLTNQVEVVKFGKKDVTYTLDLDDFITRKPNAKDRYVSVNKDSKTNKIYLHADDTDSNAISKTITVNSGPFNGLNAITAPVGGDNPRYGYISYTPNDHFVGEDRIKFQLGDGTNLSEEKTVYITVK